MTAPQEQKPRSAAFLFFFTNIAFILCVATAWSVVAVIASLKSKDWLWFARSGSVTVILGGVLSSRSVLRLSKEERRAIISMTIFQQFTDPEMKDQERDGTSVVIGVWLMVAGTLVWAYGDLLPRLWS